MQPIEPLDPPEIDPPGGGGGGEGGEDNPTGTLPGLGQYNRRRYTCNLVVSERMKGMDLLNNVVMLNARMYVTQGANGKLRMHNKKPVDFCFGLSAWAIGATSLDVDDVSHWIGNLSGFIIIDPHTNKSEAREVVTAVYDATGHNAVTLTTNEAGDIDITGFAGADADTPATATIEITNVVAGTEYVVTLFGVAVTFTPGTSDTPETVSSFLTGAFKAHPRLSRKFSFVWDNVATVTITALFGTLTVAALEKAHAAPVSSPAAAPVLAEGTGLLTAGAYNVAYTFKDEDGNQTLLSPFTSITVAASSGIDITAVTPPADNTVCWYVTVAPGSDQGRFHSENDGSAFTIQTLPSLDDPLPPDLNRTATEVMRVAALFSDRDETRAFATRSNVIKASYEWSLADQKKRYNRVDFPYHDASQDWRRIELRVHDKDHQQKIKKVESKEFNGSATDTNFQAQRLATGILAENRDAFFRYTWKATREALLLEEGDVVAITDEGSGVFNLPVMIEKFDDDPDDGGMPERTFLGPVFANTLYDDSIVERTIPVIAEVQVAGFTPAQDLTIGNTLVVSTTFASKARVHWFNTDGEPFTSGAVFTDGTITVV